MSAERHVGQSVAVAEMLAYLKANMRVEVSLGRGRGYDYDTPSLSVEVVILLDGDMIASGQDSTSI